MKITMIGAGYVGLTTAACLAELGHSATCVEKDVARLAGLQAGQMPFYEPGLGAMVNRTAGTGRLRFASVSESSWGSEITFIAVGTPQSGNGYPDLSALEEAVAEVAPRLAPDQVVALKSTVPVGTTDHIADVLRNRTGFDCPVAANPEFLREGAAIEDFLHPARVIIGTHSPLAADRLRALYGSMECPIVVTTPRTAEMIKYASNGFLAAKISFINEIASICEQVGADISQVAYGMGLDPRIGAQFLRPGVGFGGSCLPKDARALAALARAHGVTPSLLDAALAVNEDRRARFVERVDRLLGGVRGRRIGVLGLAFKPGTSDVRESPALDIAARLVARGAHVRAYDPAAEPAAVRRVPTLVACPDPYDAAEGTDVVLVLTAWPEFRDLDWERLGQHGRRPILDGCGIGVGTH